MKLWRSGLIWSVLSFGVGIGNMGCSVLMANYLKGVVGSFGAGNTAADYVTFLGLPLQMLTMSVVHYIAHFRSKNDSARLQGLLAGCQKLLLWATVGGSIVAAVLWRPLGHLFHFDNSAVLLAVLACNLIGCWASLGVALCQGMAWFKRLAIIYLIGVVFRLIFTCTVVKAYPSPWIAVVSNNFSLLALFILFYWWKDIFHHGSEKISPWTPEFVQFLVVTGATVLGNFFFIYGDSLISNNFSGESVDAYQKVAKLARAIPQTVLPLLLVTFTSRSGSKEGSARSDQRILLSLYALGLMGGAGCLILLRSQLIKLFSGGPDAAAMMIPFSISMALIGLTQAVGMWSLADRTFRVALLYGALGFIYWLTLFHFGKSPQELLKVMPIGAALCFAILTIAWFADRTHRGIRRRASAETAIV